MTDRILPKREKDVLIDTMKFYQVREKNIKSKLTYTRIVRKEADLRKVKTFYIIFDTMEDLSPVAIFKQVDTTASEFKCRKEIRGFIGHEIMDYVIHTTRIKRNGI